MNQQLMDYVESQRKRGTTDDQIREKLLENKWSIEAVSEVLNPSPAKFQGVFAQLRSAWELFTGRFVSITLVILAPGIVTFVAGFLFSLGFVFLTAYITKSLLSGGGAIQLALTIIAASVIVLIPILLLQVWGSAATLIAVSSLKKLSFLESYKQSWKYIYKFWWVSGLVTIIIMGGSFFLLIPGLIYCVWFAFAPLIVVTENEKGMSALVRSREYARGYWWAIVGRSFVMFLIALIPLLILEMIASGLGLKDNLIVTILISLVNLFLGTYLICFFYIIFKNLQEVKRNITIEKPGRKKAIYLSIGLIGSIMIFVVIPVLLILSVNPQNQIQKANEVKSNSDKQSIINAAERFYDVMGKYPSTLDELVPGELKRIPTDLNNKYCYQLEITDTSIRVNTVFTANADDCNKVIGTP